MCVYVCVCLCMYVIVKIDNGLGNWPAFDIVSTFWGHCSLIHSFDCSVAVIVKHSRTLSFSVYSIEIFLSVFFSFMGHFASYFVDEIKCLVFFRHYLLCSRLLSRWKKNRTNFEMMKRKILAILMEQITE